MLRPATAHITKIALLASLALVLSYVETLIPLPVTVPGIKLGLANITVLIALYALDTRMAFLLMLLKVAISGLLFGTFVSIAYSLTGSLLAFLGMWLLWRSHKVNIVAVSVVAAVLHNTGQLAAAAVLLSTPLVFVNLPVLIIAACITGAITGTVALSVLKAISPQIFQYEEVETDKR